MSIKSETFNQHKVDKRANKSEFPNLSTMKQIAPAKTIKKASRSFAEKKRKIGRSSKQKSVDKSFQARLSKKSIASPPKADFSESKFLLSSKKLRWVDNDSQTWVSKQSFDPSKMADFRPSKSLFSSPKFPGYESLRAGSGNVTLGNGGTISREAGTLSAAPTFSTTAHVEYTGTTGVTTGPELPLSTTVLGNLIIDNSGDVTLGADVTVNDSLIFRSGDLITDDNKLTLASGGVFSGSGDLVGNGQATFDVGIGQPGNFDELGLTIGSGADDLGSVTVERFAGDAAIVTVGANSSLKCQWQITSDNPPDGGRDLTFQWDSSSDNGKDLTQAQVYKSEDNGASWFAFGLQQDISGSGDPRSITLNTHDLVGY